LDAQATSSPTGGKSRRSYIALTAHLDTVLAPRNLEEVSIDPDAPARSRRFDNGAGLARSSPSRALFELSMDSKNYSIAWYSSPTSAKKAK